MEEKLKEFELAVEKLARYELAMKALLILRNNPEILEDFLEKTAELNKPQDEC